MKKHVSYLSRLRFDPKLLNTWSAKYLSNVRLPILMIILIIIVGIFGLMNIPRRLNPEIKIGIVTVNTSLPGASPADVESLITVPLERAVAGVEKLDTLSSVSRENNSNLQLQFLSSANTDKALNDVQKAVDTVTDLPADATDPSVRLVDFEDQPFWTFAITSKSDAASLMRFSKELKKDIENVPDVGKVQTSGYDEQTIEVIIDSQKAADFKLDPITLSTLVRSSTQSLPAGTVNSNSSSFALTINRDVTSLEDIRNLEIKTSGTSPIRLGDIATIVERSKSGFQNAYIASPTKTSETAVQFFVFKKTNADIDKAFVRTEPVVKKALQKYNGQFTLYSIMNTSDLITKQFSDLYEEFSTTILLVFGLLLVFLGLRQGLISSVTVPLTFLSSFAVINAFGLTLNFLTVFSFLLSLGIIIDDTIVVVAAMTRYYKTGKFTAYQTGVIVWHDFIVPLWSSAITTIWGFVPLLLASGIIGEFIKSIPIVVTTTMISSTLISVLITIPLMIIFLKPEFPKRVKVLLVILGVIAYIALFVALLPKNILMPFIIMLALLALYLVVNMRGVIIDRYSAFISKNPRAKRYSKRAAILVDQGLVNIELLSEKYRNIIEEILASKSARRKTLLAISAFAVVAYLLLPLGFVKNEFFPKSDEDIIYSTIEFPPGTKADIMNAEALKVADQMRFTDQSTYVVTEIGQTFSSTGDRDQALSTVLFTIHLKEEKERKPTAGEIAQSIRDKFSGFSKGTFSVIELSGGPPAGADVQIKLKGDDLGVLDTIANQLIGYLKKQPEILNPDKTIKPGTSKVVFVPDKTLLLETGLTQDQLGLWLRTYASGFKLDDVLFGDDEQDISFRTNSYDDQTLEGLGSIQIPIQTGGSVPLAALGSFKLESNPSTIIREEQKRTISVVAGVKPGFNIPQVNAKLLKYADTLQLPPGYEFETGGINEENQKSVQSILQAMLLAFLLIAITMVIEFSSFRQAFIAMLMIPISVAGVFYIFALVDTPLSFAALIGVLALFGIVMRHAIVVLEKINDNRESGLELKDAIADAAASRLEPVLLTSLATIVALIPITVADPFWRGLGGAIIAGLLFTGTLKLFFVPVLYYNFYKGEEKSH